MIATSIVFIILTIILVYLRLNYHKRYLYYICYQYENDNGNGYAGITISKLHKIKKEDDITALRESIKIGQELNEVVIINYKLLGKIYMEDE